MPEQTRSERKSQSRVIDMPTVKARPDWLGYRYLGEWNKRQNNRLIEVDLLRDNTRDLKQAMMQVLLTGRIRLV